MSVVAVIIVVVVEVVVVVVVVVLVEVALGFYSCSYSSCASFLVNPSIGFG